MALKNKRTKVGPNLVQEGEGGTIYLKINRKGRGAITRSTGTSSLEQAIARKAEMLASWDAEHRVRERKLNEAAKQTSKDVEFKPVFSSDGDRIRNLYLRSKSGIYYVRKHVKGRSLMRSTKTTDLEEAVAYLQRVLPKWVKANGAKTCPHCGEVL